MTFGECDPCFSVMAQPSSAVPEVEKNCRACGQSKPLSEFHRDRSRADGRSGSCAKCGTAAQLLRYHANPEPTLKRCREWRATNRKRRSDTDKRWRLRNPEKYIFQRLRSRCAQDGIEFNLEPSDIVVPHTCPVLGIPLVPNPNGNLRPDTTPSVDRIDPSRGYVKGNVRVISMRANRLKDNATLDELRALVRYVESELKMVGK